jgi:ribosomal protein S18 acetylase RimI-like enzyme
MIHIRRARTNETPDLQSLNNEVFIDNAKYDDDLDLDWANGAKGKKYFTDLLHDPGSFCLIAEDDEKKIGYLAAGPKEIDYRKRRYLEIQNMGVIPEYRSRGIGKLLLEECITWAKSQGFHKIFVSAYHENERAIDFYRKTGFTEIDVSLEKTI